VNIPLLLVLLAFLVFTLIVGTVSYFFVKWIGFPEGFWRVIAVVPISILITAFMYWAAFSVIGECIRSRWVKKEAKAIVSAEEFATLVPETPLCPNSFRFVRKGKITLIYGEGDFLFGYKMYLDDKDVSP
jgi:hypothetical protein